MRSPKQLRADAILDEAFGAPLIARGFERVRPRVWVRSNDAPIRQIFSFEALKYGLIRACWGLSLDFVPHRDSTGNVCWHRTARSALHDVSPEETHSRGRAERLQLNPRVRLLLVKDAPALAKWVLPTARVFWDAAPDLPSVVRAVEARLSKAQGYLLEQTRLADAFVRRALGQSSAHELLERVLADPGLQVSESAAAELRERLESLTPRV